jgi:hypothetical protein
MAFKMRGFSGFKQMNPKEFARQQKLKGGGTLKSEDPNQYINPNPSADDTDRRKWHIQSRQPDADDPTTGRALTNQEKIDLHSLDKYEDKLIKKQDTASFKQKKEDKKVKVVPESVYGDDDAMHFKGVDAKGDTAKYETFGYDAEIDQISKGEFAPNYPDSVSVQGPQVDVSWLEDAYLTDEERANMGKKPPTKKRADRQAARASKAAVKGAQAENRGKTRKAERQAVKAAKAGGGAEAAGTSSGTPVLQKSPAKQRRVEHKIYKPVEMQPLRTPVIQPVDRVPSVREVETHHYQREMPEMPKMPKMPKMRYDDASKWAAKSGSPAKQTSHGPIREYQIPEDPNNLPRVHRSKRVAKTTGPGQGPDDGPHSERPKQMQRYQDFVKEGKMNIPSNESNPLDHIFNKK